MPRDPRGLRRPRWPNWFVCFAVAAQLSCGATNALERAAAATEQSEAALRRGDATGAERSAEEALRRLAERPDAVEASGRSSAALVRALLAQQSVVGDRSVEAGERWVAWVSRAGGTNTPEYAEAVHALGSVHFLRGELAKATALHEEGLDSRRRTNASALLVADSLERLGQAATRLERFDLARRSLESAVAIRTTHAREDSVALARALELLAWLERAVGRYPEATTLLAAARRAYQSSGGEDSVSLGQLEGDLYMIAGRFELAQSSWQHQLERLDKAGLGNTPEAVALHRRLAVSWYSVGNRERSSQYLRRGLEIAERVLAECHGERMALLDHQASEALFEGRFVDARRLYDAALAGNRRCLGETHSYTATAQFNLASLMFTMGDFGEAEALYSAAVDAWSAQRRDHPYVARGLDALGEVVEAGGDIERAKELFQRALSIRQEASSTHPDMGWTLTNLARVTAAAEGGVDRALDLAVRAVRIYRRSEGAIEPDHLARTLVLQGRLLSRLGEHHRARRSLEEALRRRREFFGPLHPLTADAMGELARADWALGEPMRALQLSLEAETMGLDHLRATVRSLPERSAMDYAARRPRGLDLALAVAAATPGADVIAAADALFRARNVVLDELASRRRPQGAKPGALTDLERQLSQARERLSNVALRSLTGDPTAAEALREAQKVKESAEVALAERSAEFRSDQSRERAGFREVVAALPPGVALVSFARIMRPASGAKDISSYVALVASAERQTPAIVPIGPAVDIEHLIAQWHAALGSPSTTHDRTQVMGIHARKRLWDPIVRHLAGVQRVFVVPDGALHLVPFAALQHDDGRYLVELGPTLHVLASERDLLRYEGQRLGSGPLLAFGGIDFAAGASERGNGSFNSPRTQAPSRGGCLAEWRFHPLPETVREANEIADLWTEFDVRAGGTAQVLTGRSASEVAFRRLSSGSRILHLATHGFFLGGDCSRGPAGGRSLGVLAPSPSGFSLVSGNAERVTNPLLLSGLAFAGAEATRSEGAGADDGILTAEEVSSLDLEGTEWAVLSACDTGLGEIRAGEGVLGLRRAFQIAGVRTVIMSLWSVEDESTRRWMRALYSGRLTKGLDTATAVREASLEVLRERRAAGQSTHPFYWAAFVAAGDWH